MERLEKVRKQFPITTHWAFLNHAAESPLPAPVADAVRRYAHDSSCGGFVSEDWSDCGKPFFARMIGARAEEIALVENTSVGLNIAANSFRCPPDSKVVTTDLEYPSVVYPWLRKASGVKVHYVRSTDGKVSLDDMEKAVDDKTAVVAVSHVSYVNGFRHNLRVLSEIAHEHGAYLIVDAIQSVGTMPMDVRRDDVDFLSCACYKWLLSPPGAAYLYVRDELIEKLEPPFVGSASVDQKLFETADFWDIWNMKLSKTASRFEVGTPSRISLAGARVAMKMLLDYGLENVKNRIMELTGHLIDSVNDLGLRLQTPLEEQFRSGIVNFRIAKALKVEQKLAKRKIIVSARSHGIRVSPHYYNAEQEIDRLVTEIRRLL